MTVDDIDSAVAKVEPAGGTVMMQPMQVMDAGRMAVIGGPTGAAVCLWQAENHIGAEVVDEHGALTWTECQTSDIGVAAKFYNEVFGWDTNEMEMSPEGSYTVFLLGTDGVAGGDIPFGRQAVIADPQGAMFSVIKLTAKSDD